MTASFHRQVERLLRPASVAIVGISAEPRSLGGFVLDNILRFGFEGAIHLVSRNAAEVRGIACVNAVDALPHGVDVAVLAVPEAAVLDTVKACAARGIGAAVVFAAGYAEAGSDGQARQDALAAAAQAGGIAVVGPNCMGLTNFSAGVPLTFEQVDDPGRRSEPGISIVAQSGAMANDIREAMIGRGVPLTCSVSTGNEAVIGIEDFVEHFIDDPMTAVIAVYAEQVRQPQRFLRLAARARERGKPIVMAMIGRSDRAREAAQSHTGALTGDYATACALLEHEAVVVARTLDEVFDTLHILLRHPKPTGRGLGFVTGSGAMKNLALDMGHDLGVSFPALADATTARLRAVLPGFAVAENPLDYTTIAMRDPAAMGTVIDAVASDPHCGCMIVAQMAGSAMNQRDKAAHMVPAVARANTPAALVIMGDDGPLLPEFRQAILDSGVPFCRSPDRAMRAMALVARHGENLARHRGPESADDLQMPAPPGQGVIAEVQGKAWLAAAGIPIPLGRLAVDVEAALAIAREIGFPVVLKAQAAALPHKSDVGGVALNLRDEAALRTAWTAMHADIARARPGLVLDGVLVEKMGAPGLELVVGARRDPQWGPVVMVGLGGVWIEALQDVRLLSPEAGRAQIAEELGRLKGAALLRGLRGQPAVDTAAIAALVARVGALMRAEPALREIDINPLVAHADGVVALDALLVFEPTQ